MRLQVARTSLPYLIIKKYIPLDFLSILTLIIYIEITITHIRVQITFGVRIILFSSH